MFQNGTNWILIQFSAFKDIAKMLGYCRTLGKVRLFYVITKKLLAFFFENLPVLPWTLSFFLKSTRPSLPLKKAPPLFPSPFFSWRRLAALGNMKANFHCAHLHNLSPQGTRDVPTALLGAFFRKPTRPSLPLRKAPHLSPSLSLLRRERMCQPPFQ